MACLCGVAESLHCAGSLSCVVSVGSPGMWGCAYACEVSFGSFWSQVRSCLPTKVVRLSVQVTAIEP
jgi:hypothetical protein